MEIHISDLTLAELEELKQACDIITKHASKPYAIFYRQYKGTVVTDVQYQNITSSIEELKETKNGK